jgi:hypothetical protein
MATNAAEIEFIPDEVIEFVPDEPIDFIPDESVDVSREAQRASAGALQTLDVMRAPSQLDWSEAAVDEVNALREQSAALFAARKGDEAQKLSSQAMRLEERLQAEAPQSSGAQRLRQQQIGPQTNVEGFQAANPIGRGLASIANRVGLTPLATTIEAAGQSPLGLNFQANIGGAATGAAGAGLMMVPGAQPLGARTLAQMAAPMAAPLIGGITGGLAGNVAQENIHAATETPAETQARHAALAETQQNFPAQAMLGGSLANIFTMRPSLSQFLQAAGGNKNAQMGIAGAAGIGASMGIGLPMITGQPVSLAGVAQSALENMIFNKPTALGRKLGLPPMEGGAPPPAAPEAPAAPQTPPAAPEPSGPVVLSTAIKNPDGTLATGEALNTPHKELIRTHLQAGGDPTTEVILDNMGFKVRDPDGTERFATREEAYEIAEQSGQLAEPAKNKRLASEILKEPEVRAQPEEVAPTPEVTAEVEAEPPPTPEPEGPVVEDVGSALPAEGEPTGIRNAIVDPARAEAGIPPRELPLARSFPALHAEASAALANDPLAGVRLVAELGQNIRPLTDTEDAVLTFEQNSREQERAAAVEAVNTAEPGEARDAAIARLAAADDALFQVYQVGQQAGTANARGLAARRMMQNRDFTLAKMLNDTRAIVNNGEPLTPKQTEDTTALYNRITELESQLAKTQEKQSARAAKSEFQKILRQTKKEAGEASKARESHQTFLQRTRENAKQRIIGRRGRLQVTVDPLNIAGMADEAVIGATYVAEGVRDFAKWSDQMIGDFGERIRPHLEALFQRAAVLGDDISKEYNAKAPRTPEAILGSIKEGAKLEQRVVYDLARAHVNAGMDDFDQVMARVTADLKPRFPDVDESKVRRTLSDYGKTTTPSKESDLVKLREFKNLARLRSQLEDAERGLVPLKTGAQRDKATQKIRELQKRVNDAMRAAGISKTSPESQLASAHTARVTRLKNSIEDTQAAINAGKRPAKGTPVPWTPEELALKDQLTELNARLDAALDQPDNAKLQSLIRRAEVVAERIKTGNIGAKPRQQGADTREVAQAKDDLAKLNQELADMRKAERARENPPKTEDEKRLAALEKRRDDLFDKVSKGDTTTKTGRPTADTPEQARTRAEIAALNKQLADLRKAEKPVRPADQTRFNNLEKRLAAAQTKLAAGDLSTKPVPPTVDTARVAKAREDLAAVNKEIRNLRNSSNDIRLARDKARLERQIRTVQDRIAKGDYEQPVKREPAMDREKLELEFKLSKEKEKWNEGLIASKRAKRNLREKLVEGVGESLGLVRQILTSGDFPPVLRQGLFSIGRPVQTAKALGRAFKAMASEKQRFKINQEIENRRNAPLYQRSKLAITRDIGMPLSQMEEEYMGRWFKQLPRWTIVGPLLRASERSYNTFLNSLRADSFDFFVKALKISETDKASLDALAQNINAFTGRSKLPFGMDRGAPAFNQILFAARFMQSRFEVALGVPLWRGTMKSRAAAIDTYGRTLAALAAVYGMANMAGYETETDPRSSNFGKIDVDGTLIDPLAGLAQVTTLLTRVITGETKTAKGEVKPLREGYRPFADFSFGAEGEPGFKSSGKDVVYDFLDTKLAPVPSNVMSFIEGQTMDREPWSPQAVAKNTILPITPRQILENMQNHGVPKATALSILAMFGAGLRETDE